VLAQSASESHFPVINCFPSPLPTFSSPAASATVDDATGGAAAGGAVVGVVSVEVELATNPQPPFAAATATAEHRPEAQQVLAQSASLSQTPVINCNPFPFPKFSSPAASSSPDEVVAAVVAVVETAGEVTEAGAPGTPEAAIVLPSARAALLFGVASPWPQPPSRVWAMTGPAQRPLLTPQQAEAQSESDVQAPVMNWVP